MPTLKRGVGDLGESIAVSFLKNSGYEVIARNYYKKWGEIDIVARGTGGAIHFIEVKSGRLIKDISRETRIHPEENVTREKILKIERTAESWIAEQKYTGEWQIDVVVVLIDESRRIGTCKLIPCVY
jgi:putative endonuclease